MTARHTVPISVIIIWAESASLVKQGDFSKKLKRFKCLVVLGTSRTRFFFFGP